MSNNNEKWRGEFRNKFYPYDFANKGDEVFWQENVKWSEVIDFIASQISQAKLQGKREGLEEAEEIIANYAEEESESAILKRIRKKFNQLK